MRYIFSRATWGLEVRRGGLLDFMPRQRGYGTEALTPSISRCLTVTLYLFAYFIWLYLLLMKLMFSCVYYFLRCVHVSSSIALIEEVNILTCVVSCYLYFTPLSHQRPHNIIFV